MVRSPHAAWAASEHQIAHPVVATSAPPVNYFDMEERKTMKHRILIAYASRCGSTGEVAQAMAEVLTAQGHAADVQVVKKVQDLTPYSAVIVGSAIRMGKWLPEAVEFITRHQARLSQLPTAFFTVHMLNVEDNPESQAARAAYVAPVHQVLTPSAEAFFAGKIELARMSLFDRLMSKAMKANDQDLRDWNKIRTWAEGLYPMPA
jgi:menaquinone-dependent protoporphyrinogen oxidase